MANDSLSALKSKQRELESRISAIKQDFRQGLDKDSGERAVQLENAEVLNALMEQALQELADVKAAIAKL